MYYEEYAELLTMAMNVILEFLVKLLNIEDGCELLKMFDEYTAVNFCLGYCKCLERSGECGERL